MERILHVKENFPHFQERVLRRLFYEHFSLGIVTVTPRDVFLGEQMKRFQEILLSS